jgi:hypothetical protein
MERITSNIFSEPYGVADLRQITIGFRRKLSHEIEFLIENDSQFETFSALQAGHSRRIENRNYAVTADGRLTGTDALQEFLRSSQKWHKSMDLCPGGRFASYRFIPRRIWVPLPTEDEDSSPLAHKGPRKSLVAPLSPLPAPAFSAVSTEKAESETEEPENIDK